MKFLVSWTARDGGSAAEIETAARRNLQVFSKWSPPADQTFREFLARVDGTGGYAVIETDNPLSLADSSAKFAPWFEFQVVPVLDITDAVPLATEAIDWRDSIS
jgi:hypothetical protein